MPKNRLIATSILQTRTLLSFEGVDPGYLQMSVVYNPGCHCYAYAYATDIKREDSMVSWCKKGECNAQISTESELCGFKGANTHNKCVHDST